MRVYLSYAQKDRDLAQRLGRLLVDKGLEVWDPARELFPGDNVASKMGEALASSDALIVLFTPNSIDSDLVQGEFAYSLGDRRFKHRVIPVVSGVDEGRLPWIATTFQQVNLDRVGIDTASTFIASALGQPV